MNSVFIDRENKFLDFQIDTANKCMAINTYVKQYNWYLTPFLYNDQFKRIENLQSTGTGSTEFVGSILKETFFETRILAIYMEAFYLKLPHINDFAFLIDYGIISYLQGDYPCSINILVPIIEGVIRNYLQTKGNSNPSFNNLKDSFELMKHDILDVRKQEFINKGLSQIEYIPLLQRHDQYLSIWISFIQDFIKNGMYLDTRRGTPADFLNRHLILHALTNDIYFNESNAIKTYIAIQHLAWLFIQMTPGMHTVPSIKEEEFHQRDLDYSEIIEISKGRLSELKIRLLSRHTQFNLNDYTQ